MSHQSNHPRVSIDEGPSGVRTVTGVDTSVTAFVGRAERGPTDTAVTITSYAEFERHFGGIWALSRLGFSVRDFFLNGGSRAVVVRLFRPGTATPASNATLALGTLALQAVEPGLWGNFLRARVDYATRAFDTSASETSTSLFNLFVREDTTGVIEEHRNLVVAPTTHPRFVTTVLKNGSRLVTVTAVGGTRPNDSGGTVDPGKTVWDDNATATNNKVSGSENLASDGLTLTADEFNGVGKEAARQGLFALENTDLFNLMVVPPYTTDDTVDTDVVTSAARYCEKRRAMLLVDPLPGNTWGDARAVKNASAIGFDTVLGTTSKNAALFFPRLLQPNPLNEDQVESFAPSGVMAGVMARTDGQRGVWKAPAGPDAYLVGVPQLEVPLNDGEIGLLNPVGVNCLREMPGAGPVAWGARTMQVADLLVPEWTYLPVRRTALFIEQSLYRGTQWVVFEPNGEPLWAQIRVSVDAFMNNLFRRGAFRGATPREAYFVKCDTETTTQADIDLGTVRIFVGFAPLRPAEFVVVRLQQMAGQSAT